METKISLGLLWLAWGTHFLATIPSTRFAVPVLVVHFGSVRPDKLLAQLGYGGLVCHVFRDKSPIQPEPLCIPHSVLGKIEYKTVCFRAKYGSQVGLEERQLPQTTMTVMGETDVLFILTPVEGQVPGFLTLNVLVTETSLGLPAFATTQI